MNSIQLEAHRLREVERRARERAERLEAVNVNIWRRWRAGRSWSLWHVLGPDNATLCGKAVPWDRISYLPKRQTAAVPEAQRCKRCNLIAEAKSDD